MMVVNQKDKSLVTIWSAGKQGNANTYTISKEFISKMFPDIETSASEKYKDQLLLNAGILSKSTLKNARLSNLIASIKEPVSNGKSDYPIYTRSVIKLGKIFLESVLSKGFFIDKYI